MKYGSELFMDIKAAKNQIKLQLQKERIAELIRQVWSDQFLIFLTA